MAGPLVDDAELHPPDVELAESVDARRGEWRAVVRADGFRNPIFLNWTTRLPRNENANGERPSCCLAPKRYPLDEPSTGDACRAWAYSLGGGGRALRCTVEAFVIAVLFASTAAAEERDYPEIGKTLVIEKVGPANSDAVHLQVSLRDIEGGAIVEFPRMVGSVLLSTANAQLFSCESNSTLATSEAMAFHLDSRPSFSFPHRGYLRNCGLTGDGRLYWLHYNVVREGVPRNQVVVLNGEGKAVADAEFTDARQFTFKDGEKTYSLSIPAADWPG